MTDPVAVVRAFVEAWNRMDLEAVLGFLHPDIHYHNIPLPPLDGRETVAAYLRQAWVFSDCDWELRNVAADGATVLTERVDAFTINGARVVLPVMGVFEISDGLIRQWRDYFDLDDYRRQLRAAGAATAAGG
jgi:limonene-1,2-epoxide hydrolase